MRTNTRGVLLLQDGRRFNLDAYDELIAAAVAVAALPRNTLPPPAADVKIKSGPKPKKAIAEGLVLPLDDYNERCDRTEVEQLLIDAGWSESGSNGSVGNWTRPDKNARNGHSATLGYLADTVLSVFSTSDSLLPGKSPEGIHRSHIVTNHDVWSEARLKRTIPQKQSKRPRWTIVQGRRRITSVMDPAEVREQRAQQKAVIDAALGSQAPIYRAVKTDIAGRSRSPMSDQELLSGPQEKALLAVMQGDDYTAAAMAAGVARETVSRWANGDTPWARERRRRTEALWAEHQNQVVNLLPMALGALEWLLRDHRYRGDDHYDARTQLQAVELVLRLNGIPLARGPALAVQINNTVESRDE